MFFKKIGIDLGTTSILIYEEKKGIILNEPSIVAINKKGKILAIGNKAKKMLGKTPKSIEIIKPIKQGVLSDYNMTESMLKYFIYKAIGKRLFKPKVVICVPSKITQVEHLAVESAARYAGARKVKIITEPVAAAIGSNLNITHAFGHMIVDIGGGTSDIAVISLGDEVVNNSLRIAGDDIDQAIINYIRKKYNLIIGEATAEEIKISLGGAINRPTMLKMSVNGKSILSGLPISIMITSEEITRALKEIVDTIISAIYNVMEITPPELIADIMKQGIILTGGGSLLYGLDTLITNRLGVKVKIANDPKTCVVTGTGIYATYIF